MTMCGPYGEGLPPQGIQIYEFLIRNGPATAKQIGRAMRIASQSVYRITSHLMQLGLITESSFRPKSFLALGQEQARERFAAHQKLFFDRLFSRVQLENDVNAHHPGGAFSVLFIEGRAEIFRQLSDDINQASTEANFIVLGLPEGVTPELLLAQKNAVARGVPIRVIVQEFSRDNWHVLRSWREAGITVKHGKALRFHLLLVDPDITYLMTYDPSDKSKRYAVRLTHHAINREMQRLFEYHWRRSRRLS